MNVQDAEKQATQAFGEAHSQESLQSAASAGSDFEPRTIKYMDNDTFRRSLNKVLDVHARLLAKLAE